MKLKLSVCALYVLAAFGALSEVAQAQAQDASQLSAEEIEALFQSQKTRGLVIAPAADAVPDAGATDAEQTYVEVDPLVQVNIRISFDFDSAALRDTEKSKLVALCQAMKSSDVDVFRIVGHTDSAGAASYNERLSLLRAQEVKRHLVSECGVAESRLEAIGVGQSHPLDPADPRSEVNRRVEFQVVS